MREDRIRYNTKREKERERKRQREKEKETKESMMDDRESEK